MKEMPPPRDPVELMGQAYERLLETVIEDARKLEHKGGPALRRLIEGAREKLSELGEFTEEELERVAEYLERDLEDVARYIARTGSDLSSWLGFDLKLLEERLAELFLQAADPTIVELNLLHEEAEQAGYHTGEVAGPGTFVCDQCGEEIHLRKPAPLPPCPKCHGTVYHRKYA